MYKLILFDVDGVFLSEERCFDASALSVWELLYAPHFLGIEPESFTDKPDEKRISQVRQQVFQNNRVLDWMKSKGINSNWDMVYLVFSGQLMLMLKEWFAAEPEKVKSVVSKPITAQSLQELGAWMKQSHRSYSPKYDQFMSLFADWEQVEKHELLTVFNQLAKKWFKIQVDQFSRNSALWELGRSVYQEWYLGAKRYQQKEQQPVRNPAKSGFLEEEIPLAEPNKIRRVLEELKQRGITLGIGTGRPQLETEVPLTALGLYDVFDPERIVSASDVILAEEAYPEKAPLGKPHPYTYLKGVMGRTTSDRTCLATALPLINGNEILIVGDSVADYLAAKKMGCRFAATLTGLTGQAARAKFEELKADHILDDVTEILTLFTK